MKSFFIDIYSYHYKHNQIVIEVLQNNTRDPLVNSRDWMAHILYAHHIWLDRIHGAITNDGINFKDFNTWKFINHKNYKRSLRTIKNMEMNHLVAYENSTGDKFDNTLSQILYHIVNHTAHHRGMIIADFRLSGIEPPVTDYIFDKR